MTDAEQWGTAQRLNCNADGAASANISKTKKSNKIPQDAVKRGENTTNDNAKRGGNATVGTGQTSRRSPGSHAGRRNPRFDAMRFNAMMTRLGLDLKERLHECVPSTEAQLTLKRCFEELQMAIAQLGPRWKLQVFGSIASGFLTSKSDMDVTCVRGPAENGDEEDEEVDAKAILLDRFSKQFRDHADFEVIEEIPSAKVPILRLRFEGNLDIDLSCQNTLALQNTALLRAYAQIDHRVLQLGIAVKLWTKAAKVCGAAQSKLSSYTFTLLLIYFMQVHQDVQLPHLDTALFEEKSDPSKLAAVVHAASASWSPFCGLTLPHLFFRFIYFYRFQFEWGSEVASIRVGDRRYAREECFKALRGRHVRRIHVEDPYVLERNLHCVLGDPEEDQLKEAFNTAFQVLWSGGTPEGLIPSAEPRVPLQLSGMLPGESPHFSPQSSPDIGPNAPPFLAIPPADNGPVAMKPGLVHVTDKAALAEPHPEPHPEPQPGSSEGGTESSDGCPPPDPCASSSGEDDENTVKPHVFAPGLLGGATEGVWWQNLTSTGVKQALWANAAPQEVARPRVLSLEQLESQMVHKQDIAALGKSPRATTSAEKWLFSPQPSSNPSGQWWLNLGSAKTIEAVGAVAPQEGAEQRRKNSSSMKVLTVQDLEGKMTQDVPDISASSTSTGVSPLLGGSFATRATGKIASRLASKYFGQVPVPIQ